jgi:hypothetical protein
VFFDLTKNKEQILALEERDLFSEWRTIQRQTGLSCSSYNEPSIPDHCISKPGSRIKFGVILTGEVDHD